MAAEITTASIPSDTAQDLSGVVGGSSDPVPVSHEFRNADGDSGAQNNIVNTHTGRDADGSGIDEINIQDDGDDDDIPSNVAVQFVLIGREKN